MYTGKIAQTRELILHFTFQNIRIIQIIIVPVRVMVIDLWNQQNQHVPIAPSVNVSLLIHAMRGGPWYTRTGSNFSSPSGSCAWVKRKLTFPYHARKLIYQHIATFISVISYLNN